MSRVIVCGSRTWSDLEPIDEALTCLNSGIDGPLVVVHGGCPSGADRLANEWAKASAVKVEVFPAHWDRYGASAGPKRNRQMAKAGASMCLAFWNGESRGTLDMITAATQHGIPVRIYPARDR